jgi:two-component system NtrC family sensor kinase
MRLLRGLGAKLILFIAAILIVAVGLFSYKMIVTHQEQSIEDATRWASELSDAVKRSTKYDMLRGEEGREALHYTIDAIGAQKGMEKVRIFSSEGKIMFSTDKDEVGNILDKEREQCYVCHAPKKPLEKLDLPGRSKIIPKTEERDYRILGIINPIYNEKDCFACHSEEQKVLGVLDFEISLAEVDAKTRKNFYAILFFTFITISMVSLTVGIFIYRAVSRPIKKMVLGTKRIADGDFEQKVNLESRDEIGKLARRFNLMVEAIKERDEKIKQQTQQVIVKSERLAMIGQLAAGVAHEINNPLAGLLIYIKLMKKIISELKDSLPSQGDFSEYLTLMDREGKRCSEVVRNLLNFARQSEPFSQPININSVLREALSFLESQIIIKDIKVEKKLDHLPQIIADFSQIQQAFMNIMLNACEAMEKGGVLTINTRSMEDNGMMEIEIKDSGKGIPPEILPKIFEPFFTTKKKGTGLGLSAAYGIITQHGGTIEVDSNLENGTKFTIKLPINHPEIKPEKNVNQVIQ